MPMFTLTELLLSPRLRLLAAVLWGLLLAAIAVASLMPNFGPPADYNVDKVLHFLGYGGAAGLPFLAFNRARRVFAAALAMAPLGVALEALQQFVPGRAAETGDALANLGGVLIGLAIGPIARAVANRWFVPLASRPRQFPQKTRRVTSPGGGAK